MLLQDERNAECPLFTGLKNFGSNPGKPDSGLPGKYYENLLLPWNFDNAASEAEELFCKFSVQGCQVSDNTWTIIFPEFGSAADRFMTKN